MQGMDARVRGHDGVWRPLCDQRRCQRAPDLINCRLVHQVEYLVTIATHNRDCHLFHARLKEAVHQRIVVPGLQPQRRLSAWSTAVPTPGLTAFVASCSSSHRAHLGNAKPGHHRQGADGVYPGTLADLYTSELSFSGDDLRDEPNRQHNLANVGHRLANGVRHVYAHVARQLPQPVLDRFCEFAILDARIDYAVESFGHVFRHLLIQLGTVTSKVDICRSTYLPFVALLYSRSPVHQLSPVRYIRTSSAPSGPILSSHQGRNPAVIRVEESSNLYPGNSPQIGVRCLFLPQSLEFVDKP